MKKFLTCMLSMIISISLFGCNLKMNEETMKNETTNIQKTEENKIQEENKIEEDKKIAEDNNDKNIEKEQNKKQDDIKDKKTINKKVVVIDPGHSACGNREKEKQSPDSNIMKIKDPGGAQGNFTKVPEYVICMKVALKLKKLLEENDITVIMTKTQDNESPGNIERAEVGNKNNADLEIRIHCDSAENTNAHGASMLTPEPIGYAKSVSNISKEYGKIILNDLVSQAGMYNRGVNQRDDLTGFNWSKVPVVLIEMGFMSNQQEDKLLNDDNYQNKLSLGLCNGILNALRNVPKNNK